MRFLKCTLTRTPTSARSPNKEHWLVGLSNCRNAPQVYRGLEMAISHTRRGRLGGSGLLAPEKRSWALKNDFLSRFFRKTSHIPTKP